MLELKALLILCVSLIMTVLTVYAEPYNHDGAFEMPLVGSTGWTARAAGEPLRTAPNNNAPITKSLPHGTGFVILREAGAFWYVRLGNDTTGYVRHRYAFINLPDIMQSMEFDITNATASAMRTHGQEIEGVTGQQLYSAKAFNHRLGRYEYIVPILYATAHRLMNAQNAALADGNTIIMYEAFRPFATQVQVYSSITQAQRGLFSYPWTFGWFLSTPNPRVFPLAENVNPARVSNHQRGTAVDVGLRRVDGEVFVMPTEIHELSAEARVTSRPGQNSRTQRADSFSASEGAALLQSYLVGAGFTPLISEWWHFDDFGSRASILGGATLVINGNFFTPTVYSLPVNYVLLIKQ